MRLRRVAIADQSAFALRSVSAAVAGVRQRADFRLAVARRSLPVLQTRHPRPLPADRVGQRPTVCFGLYDGSATEPLRADHYGDATLPLDQSIRDLVAAQAGFRPAGPIRLLTHFRYCGYGFNPLSAYYCYGTDGELQAIVLEVSNMPWREMHHYVLTRGSPIANGGYKFEFAKAFHVSPFLPMDMAYRCRLAPPGPRLAFALENWRQGARCFDAHLSFQRVAITSRSLARVLAIDPLATLRVTTLIHWYPNFEMVRMKRGLRASSFRERRRKRTP